MAGRDAEVNKFLEATLSSQALADKPIVQAREISFEKNYLPGLDGLRALAAIVVVIFHVYLDSPGYSIASYEIYFEQAALAAVNLFFVISGFIISYLLYHEKTTTGTIRLYRFYRKRALRIWPVYYLLIFLVFIISKYTTLYDIYPPISPGAYPLLILFLANVNFLFGFSFTVLGHYWTLGVEEQFYLFWPVLFRSIKVVWLCILVIGVLFIVRNVTEYFYQPKQVNAVYIIHDYFYKSPFGSMAIGALAAIGLRKNWPMQWLGKDIVWGALWASLIYILATYTHIKYAYLEVCAIIYAGIILSSIYRKKSFLDWRPLRRLGRLSYGIYMYHIPLIPVAIYLLTLLKLQFIIELWNGVPYIFIVLGMTIAIASPSYRYIELPFLKRK